MQKANLKAVINVKAPNQQGYTLIEVISVMVIMSVVVSVVIKKMDVISDNSALTALSYGIRELNTRECVVWSKIKISDSEYSNDTDVYNAIDKNLGPEYIWNPSPYISGGRLYFKSKYIDLIRVASTPTSPGSWK